MNLLLHRYMSLLAHLIFDNKYTDRLLSLIEMAFRSARHMARLATIRHNIGYMGANCYIDKQAELFGLPNIILHDNVSIMAHAILQCAAWHPRRQNDYSNQQKIIIGKGTTIQPYAYLISDGGTIEIGSYCSVNPYTILRGQGGLKIGNHVRIASHTNIIPSKHVTTNTNVPIYTQGLLMKGIVIEDDVWIGCDVTILDGVRIGEGSVVGAGAVLTKDVPPFAIVAGVPAKVLRMRK